MVAMALLIDQCILTTSDIGAPRRSARSGSAAARPAASWRPRRACGHVANTGEPGDGKTTLAPVPVLNPTLRASAAAGVPR
jgi:hypothetical protein